MTVLETELSQVRHLPSQTQDLERLLSATGTQPALFCANINQLNMPHFQKADQLVHQMAGALLNGQADAFNESRQQLCSLLKKHGQPVTQWNPLVLELASSQALQGRSLSRMNFGMTRLCSPEGLLSLEQCNLQGASFLCADLSQLSLTEADLSGADCRYADLREVDLTKATLIEADLSHAKLSSANLREADLYCAKLSSTLIKQTCLREANLRKANLRNADLYQADLSGARLQNVDLREANLFMADLSGAKLRHADMRKSHLGFCNLSAARLPNARLEAANLTNANLTAADLQKCRLSGGIYNRAQFSQAKMNLCQLQSADLSETVDLETSILQGATFDQHTRFPKGFKPKKHALNSTHLGLKGLLNGLFNRVSPSQEL